MGRGYWIIIADDFGDGLQLINGLIYHDENGRNWWPVDGNATDEQIIAAAFKAHDLERFAFAKVVV